VLFSAVPSSPAGCTLDLRKVNFNLDKMLFLILFSYDVKLALAKFEHVMFLDQIEDSITTCVFEEEMFCSHYHEYLRPMSIQTISQAESRRSFQKFTGEEEKRMYDLLCTKAEYEEKRRLLNKQLNDVNVKIVEVQSEYGAIYNRRCPVLQLPVEVTCLIFEHSQLPTVVDEEEEEEEEEEYLMEVVVSHVCRRWRKIALGYPKLWTKFYYEADEDHRRPSSVPLARLEAYMVRSATQPVRLWLDFGQDSSYEELDNELVNKAIDHVQRWKHFVLFSAQMSLLSNHVPRLSHVSAPFLEYLVLRCNAEDYADEMEDFESEGFTSLDSIILNNGAPKLSFLMLDGTSICCIPPLSNITTLRLEKGDQTGHCVPASIFVVLLSLPTLEHLSLVGDVVYMPEDSVQLIHMSNLKRLRVANLDAVAFSGIITRIRAPKLETFIIHTCASLMGLTLQHEPYAYPALRNLWIIESSMETTVAAYFMKLTSRATDVFISQENMDEGFFNSLVYELPATQEIWPRLKTLKCQIEGYTVIEPYVVFAQSRPEKSFTFVLHRELVEYWENEEPEIIPGLKKMCTLNEVDDDGWIQDESFWPEDMELAPGFDQEDRDPFVVDAYYTSSL